MRTEELRKQAIELLRDDDLFIEMVDALDSWNGYADGYRGFPMWEIDDLFCDTKVSDFLDMLADGFNHRDDFFVDTIYGIDSVNDLAAWYRENTDEEEVLDNLIDNYCDVDITDDELEEIVEQLTETE